MKHYLTLSRHYIQKFVFLFVCGLISVMSFAQDKKEIDVNVNSNKNNFWGSPVIWIVGAAIFILLLVAILRGGNRRNA